MAGKKAGLGAEKFTKLMNSRNESVTISLETRGNRA